MGGGPHRQQMVSSPAAGGQEGQGGGGACEGWAAWHGPDTGTGTDTGGHEVPAWLLSLDGRLLLLRGRLGGARRLAGSPGKRRSRTMASSMKPVLNCHPSSALSTAPHTAGGAERESRRAHAAGRAVRLPPEGALPAPPPAPLSLPPSHSSLPLSPVYQTWKLGCAAARASSSSRSRMSSGDTFAYSRRS